MKRSITENFYLDITRSLTNLTKLLATTAALRFWWQLGLHLLTQLYFHVLQNSFQNRQIMKLLSCVFLLLQMYEICKCRLCSTSHVAYKTCKTEPTINKRIFNKLNLKPAEPNPDSYRFFLFVFLHMCQLIKKKKNWYMNLFVSHTDELYEYLLIMLLSIWSTCSCCEHEVYRALSNHTNVLKYLYIDIIYII